MKKLLSHFYKKRSMATSQKVLLSVYPSNQVWKPTSDYAVATRQDGTREILYLYVPFWSSINIKIDSVIFL
jgi:hypothetical protein